MRGSTQFFSRLLLNSIKLLKCFPTFVQARDAIIHADEILTGGENACELWDGFAERGFGVDAHSEVGKLETKYYSVRGLITPFVGDSNSQAG